MMIYLFCAFGCFGVIEEELCEKVHGVIGLGLVGLGKGLGEDEADLVLL